MSLLLKLGAASVIGAGAISGSYYLYKKYRKSDVDPKDNYYLYVNGEWLKNTKIPSEFAQYTNFHKLMVDNRNKLIDIAKSDENNVGKVYKMSMNVPEQPSNNLKEVLERLNHISNHKDLQKEMAILWCDYGVNTMFYLISRPDDKQSDLLVPTVIMSGLNLPDKSYYDGSNDHAIHKDAYINYVNKIGNIYNVEFNALNLWKFEETLAEKHLTPTQKRDPDLTYNKVSWTDFMKYFPSYCENLRNISKMDYVVVDNIGLCNFYRDEFEKLDLETMKEYVKLRLIDHYAKYDTQQQRDLHFEFHEKVLSGIQKPKELWKFALDNIDQLIGDEIGKIYVEKYYPESNRVFLNNMVGLIKIQLKRSIELNDWMASSTKTIAYEKLDSMKFDFGSSEEYHKFDGLWEKNEYANLIDMINDYYSWYWVNNHVNKFYTKVNPKLWDMCPHIVNAYYDSSLNKMVFPAGILQPPFFDMSKDISYNLGTIGMIIGHEMIHGFDDQGRKYDQHGNLRDWWSVEDDEKFKRKAQIVKEQYEKVLVQGKPVNGDLTMGENIADIGGLKLASEALYCIIKDKSDEEKEVAWRSFFEGYAQLFKALRTPEIELKFLTIDPHSPTEARTNIPLKNNIHFQRFLKMNESDKMYMSDSDIINIW
uniref:Peptidase M13 C-terminal domain-containing protein n=1 Tax=viral metagenome TaxID=1070528 RepID=A0A6C0E5P7_9ZZZZ